MPSFQNGLLIAALALGFTGARAEAANSCTGLAAIKLHGVSVTSTEVVAAGQYVPAQHNGPGATNLFGKLPAFCRVQATLTPSRDSAIHIELWLPETGWNGKLAEGGNGGFSPMLNYQLMAQGLLQGYATTSSDTGHTEDSGSFAVGHPQKLIDFGYRAVHENVVAAKALIKARYGDAARHAYFSGCSTGGRQALGEAQRYPEDFDGIVAGAPGINTTHQTAMQTWVGALSHRDAASVMPLEKYAMLHSAVLRKCDALDGVKDGVIENPLRCDFDLQSLRCKDADMPDCLTAAQIDMLSQIYAGPTSPAGKQVFTGLLLGSEQNWGRSLATEQPMIFALDFYRYLVKQDAHWNYRSLDLDRDVAVADRTVASITNNSDTDIRRFLARGKLIGYHGWADPGISPYNSINYYKAVAANEGGVAAIDNSYRLFMVPGMAHCGGGDGTDQFDLLSGIDAWVADRHAPDSIPAARVRNGAIDRTRPLCPFPKQAVYSGTGSIDDSANFSCKVL